MVAFSRIVAFPFGPVLAGEACRADTLLGVSFPLRLFSWSPLPGFTSVCGCFGCVEKAVGRGAVLALRNGLLHKWPCLPSVKKVMEV